MSGQPTSDPLVAIGDERKWLLLTLSYASLSVSSLQRPAEQVASAYASLFAVIEELLHGVGGDDHDYS